MKRTYVLLALVIVAAAIAVKTRILGAHSALETAKDRIRHIEQQPAAHQVSPKAQKPALKEERRAAATGQPAEILRQQVDAPDSAPGSERTMHLIKGTFTQVDGTLVYSADAQLDIGHGLLVSSPTGVMVADEELRHISGDLVVERAGTATTMENAFLTVDGNHVEITSDSATTVANKEDAKQP